MIPAKYNFPDQYKGDTFDGIQFTLRINGSSLSYVDLTGASIKCSFKGPRGPVIKTITNGDGINIINASGGKFEIEPFILDWEQNVYNYDIQITFPSGEIKTYIKGYVNIVIDTTK